MSKNECICDCNIIHQSVVDEVKKKMPDSKKLYDLANLFKLIGDPTRCKILFALDQKEMCVCDLSNGRMSRNWLITDSSSSPLQGCSLIIWYSSLVRGAALRSTSSGTDSLPTSWNNPARRICSQYCGSRPSRWASCSA